LAEQFIPFLFPICTYFGLVRTCALFYALLNLNHRSKIKAEEVIEGWNNLLHCSVFLVLHEQIEVFNGTNESIVILLV
jgi:hypothetical protein